MAKYPYSFLIDGTQTRLSLGGKTPIALPLGTRLWVKGEIKSELKPSTPDRIREAWRVYVDVTEYQIISNALKRTKGAEQGVPPYGAQSAPPGER